MGNRNLFLLFAVLAIALSLFGCLNQGANGTNNTAGFSCGSTITNDTVLTSDLYCNGTAIIIGADNITLDCAGHSLNGDGSHGDGVDNTAGHSYVTVENCLIANFNNSIDFENGATYGTIIDNIVSSNSITSTGILLASSYYNIIANNVASYNGAGIFLGSSPSNIIANNTVSSNFYYGIYLESSVYDLITNNNVSSNSEYGILFESNSSNNFVVNNTADSNVAGIWFDGSPNNTLTDNAITKTDGQQGLYVGGSSIDDFQQNITDNNTINGLPVYYRSNLYGGCPTSIDVGTNYSWFGLVNCADVAVTADPSNSLDHMMLAYTNNTNITDADVTGSQDGIFLFSSSHNQIRGSFANSDYVIGIDISSGSDYNTIANNTARNDSAGIYLSFNSDYNTIANNSASNSIQYGIYILSSSNNSIYNNFFNDSADVYLAGNPSNYWNTTLDCANVKNIVNGSCIGGNFWAQPDGSGFSQNCNSTNNGICGSSYVLNSSNVDYLPLKAPA